MSVPYLRFEVSFHGVNFTKAQAEFFRAKLKAAAEEVYPDRQMDSDVEVDFVEHAGEFTC